MKASVVFAAIVAIPAIFTATASPSVASSQKFISQNGMMIGGNLCGSELYQLYVLRNSGAISIRFTTSANFKAVNAVVFSAGVPVRNTPAKKFGFSEDSGFVVRGATWFELAPDTTFQLVMRSEYQNGRHGGTYCLTRPLRFSTPKV